MRTVGLVAMGWPAEHAAWAAAGIHGAIFVPLKLEATSPTGTDGWARTAALPK